MSQVLLVLAPGIVGLIILQIIHLIDINQRDKNKFQSKPFWFFLMLIPFIGGFFAMIYRIFVMPKLPDPLPKRSKSIESNRRDDRRSVISAPVKRKTPPKTKPKPKPEPVPEEDIVPENKPESTRPTSTSHSTPPSGMYYEIPLPPLAKKSGQRNPQDEPKRTPSIKKTTPSTDDLKPLVEQAKPAAPKSTPPTEEPVAPTQKIVGYGDDRRNRIIEANAAEPPIDGRPRVHEIDKINVKEDGLLVTNGLTRRHLTWEEIYIIIGAQSPVGVRDSLLIDMFVEGQTAPYRIYDHVIMYQDFMSQISFNSEDNFREFIQYILTRTPRTIVEPETQQFVDDPNKHFAHQFRKLHEFDVYVWKIRNQVLSAQESAPPPAKSTPHTNQEHQSQPKPVSVESQQKEKYAIIMRGIQAGKEKHVLQILMHIYKNSPEKTKKMMKTPSIIGQNLNQDVTTKISEALKKQGAKVQIVTMSQLAEMRKRKS